MPEEIRANSDEHDQPKGEDTRKPDRRSHATRGEEDLLSRLSPEPPMSMRLCTEPGSSPDAVKHYIECVCKKCSQSFRFHIPLPHGQSQPTSCLSCGLPFSKEDALRLVVFVDYMTAKLFDDESDRPLYLTGTCVNCLSRFRFDAREICDLEAIHCPHCGFDFGEDGKAKLIEHARKLLGKTRGRGEHAEGERGAR